MSKNKKGKYISTKKVGSDEREDITLEYKHQKQEIENPVSVSIPVENRKRKKIKITFKLPSKICISYDLTGNVMVEGMSEEVDTVIKREMYLTSYTGKYIHGFLDESSNSEQPSIEFPFHVSSLKINEFLTKEAQAIKCKVTVFDPQLDELKTKYFIVQILKPTIEIVSLQKIVSLHSPIVIRICVKNLLQENLTNLKITVLFTDYNPRDITIGTLNREQIHFQPIGLIARSNGKKWITIGQVSDQCSGFVCTESFYVTD